MKRILIAFYLIALSIVMFEFTVSEFQTNNTFSYVIGEVSETVEKANKFSIDEDIMYPHSIYKDVFACINFTSENTINTIYNISYEILQPPR